MALVLMFSRFKMLSILFVAKKTAFKHMLNIIISEVFLCVLSVIFYLPYTSLQNTVLKLFKLSSIVRSVDRNNPLKWTCQCWSRISTVLHQSQIMI